MAVQVDEQSVFRHRGERKVKTVEEDIEEDTSTTAELLNEDGEELIGRENKITASIYCVPKWKPIAMGVVIRLSPAAGDESSNEDQGEEGEGEEMEKNDKKPTEKDDGAELSAVHEEDNTEGEEGREEGSEEEEQLKTEESNEFNFPDTTISLSHLQPSR